MSKLTWEDLVNKKIAIHTPTEDIMRLVVNTGIKMLDIEDGVYEDCNNGRTFYVYKKNSCVDFGNYGWGFGSEQLFRNEYYEVVEYEEVRHLFEIERIVEPNQIYRHFKGKYYATLGVSTPISEREFPKLLPIHHREQVYHTELERNIMIIQKDNKLYHRDIFSEDELVIYTPLYFSDYPIYARPKNMFLSKTDLNKHPEATQEYRMELIK